MIVLALALWILGIVVCTLLILRIVGGAFYCQRDIEGQTICDKQCDHCQEYYKPLEQ